MIVKREQQIDNLVGSMHNGLVKVVTGIRRCGKSFLLERSGNQGADSCNGLKCRVAH